MYMTMLLYLRICCKESFYLFDVLIANYLFHIMISFLCANQVSINIFFLWLGMDPPLWFATLFPWSVSATYFEKSRQTDPTWCLIDSPEVTLSHPIIDFDVNATCDIILKTAKIRPSYRTQNPF